MENNSLSFEEIIIKKKDLENLGRKVMKEVYEFLHDECILTFEEMKVEKDNIEKYLVSSYLRNIHKIERFVYDKSKEKNYKEYKKELEDESKCKEYLKEIENKIEDESLDFDLIYEVLDLIKLEFEIDEDLFVKKKAFCYIYSVCDIYHDYLKD